MYKRQVVPFHYDLVTVPSTASFLLFLDRLRQVVGDRMNAQLFIIPNLNDNRVGKRSELILWDNTRETFSNYGYVTGKIPRRADMERFSTVAALDMQIRYVGNVFDKIYFSIFGKVTPVREAKLTGIQLTDNLNPKIGKKKNREEGVTHIAMDEDGNEEEREAGGLSADTTDKEKTEYE